MIDDKVRSIVRKLSEAKGQHFFDNIVTALAQVIDADFTFIAELDDEFTTATSIALAADGQLADNFSYALRGTPCANVANANVCVHHCDIQALYPEDQLLIDMGVQAYVGTPLFQSDGSVAGLVVALFKEPLVNSGTTESLFLLFSGLIGGELEKRNKSRQLALAQRVLDTCYDAVLICDKQMEIEYVNRAFSEMTGYQLEEIRGKAPNILSSGEHDKAFYQAMWSSIEQQGSWSGEIWNRKKDGTLYPSWLTISSVQDTQGQLSHYTGIAYDISKQKDAEAKIRYQATHDLLTGLPNRALFVEQLQQMIDDGLSANQRIDILVFNIDHFKSINDTLGQQNGDQLLRLLAARLKQHWQDQHLVARTGGDEFALLVKLDAEQPSQALISQLGQLMEEPFLLHDQQQRLTLSTGIVSHKAGMTRSADELLSFAFSALEVAKRSGRNQSILFDQQLQAQLERRLALKRQLQTAIVERQFQVYYQPILELSSKRIRKCEALVRWFDHNDQLIPPDQFIPIAEEFGFMPAIGQQVLEQSCRDLQQLHQQIDPGFKLAINRSVQEFAIDNTQIDQWLQTIEQHRLPQHTIIFEITESLLAPEHSHYLEALNALKQAGCQIAIDDFGTGYSSLAYLQRFPVDLLKIDRSFIKALPDDEQANSLTSAIIAMAHALNIGVVAEGIENGAQQQALNALGCEFGQGFEIARPMPFDQLLKFLAQR